MSTEMDLEEALARTPLRRATFRRLAGYLKPHRKALAIVMGLEGLWVISMLVDPELIGWVVDGPLQRGDVHGVAWILGLMTLNLALRAVATRVELRASTRIGVQVIDRLRREVFEHVQRLSMRYFDRTKQGRIIARADRDVDTLEHLMFWGPIMLTMMTFSLTFGTVVLFMVNARLAMWMLVGAPVVWGVSRLFHKVGFPAYRRVREEQSHISAHVAETIQGVRVVQAFGQERREIRRLDDRQRAYRDAVMRGAHISGAYLPTLGLVFQAATLAMLVAGAPAVVAGTLPVGELFQVLLMMGFILGPIEMLGGLYNECLVAGAAAERIFLLLDTEPEIADVPDAIDPGRLEGHVAFEEVWFGYDPETDHDWQLQDVSFEVKPGETLALVGHTGAGKTSVINLLSRFYEAQRGRITIDGHELSTLQLEALHRQTGIVLQSSFLFAGSVLENLRFVDPGLTPEQARAGFAALDCEHVLDQLNAGLETDVGERGANLSEGERQLVCFVRALLSEPTLLILDEATSAVDTRTEAMLLRALKRLASKQTTVVIAHRLSTIRQADRILVMEHGRIIERGTHQELLAHDGAYARLYAQYAA